LQRVVVSTKSLAGYPLNAAGASISIGVAGLFIFYPLVD
jgi:hypothetical protein